MGMLCLRYGLTSTYIAASKHLEQSTSVRTASQRVCRRRKNHASPSGCEHSTYRVPETTPTGGGSRAATEQAFGGPPERAAKHRDYGQAWPGSQAWARRANARGKGTTRRERAVGNMVIAHCPTIWLLLGQKPPNLVPLLSSTARGDGCGLPSGTPPAAVTVTMGTAGRTKDECARATTGLHTYRCCTHSRQKMTSDASNTAGK